MFKKQIYYVGGSSSGSALNYLPGLTLVLLGILVLLMPQLLVLFVSFSLISIGLTGLIAAHRWRNF